MFNKFTKEVKSIECKISSNEDYSSLIDIKINNLKGSFKSDVSEFKNKFLLVPSPKMTKKKTSNGDDSLETEILFLNEFEQDPSFRYDQDPLNLYKIGNGILKILVDNKFLELSKFKIVYKKGLFNCEYCDSNYKLIYQFYYDSKLIFETKHNGLSEENNCPFLIPSIENDGDFDFNFNILSELIFEFIKEYYKNKISFAINEKDMFGDTYIYNGQNNLSRTINIFDCCIGLGKDSMYNKAIYTYKTLSLLNLDSKKTINVIILRKLIKVELNNKLLEFYDVKNEKFAEINNFNFDNEKRFKLINEIALLYTKKFNLVFSN